MRTIPDPDTFAGVGQAKSIDSESLARLRSAIEQAPFHPEGWRFALHSLAEATGSPRTQILALGQRHMAFNWVNTTPDDFESIIREIDTYRPDANYRIAAMGKPMELTWEPHYDAVRAVHTDERYLEMARRYDFELGAQMVLSQKPGLFFGVAIMRSEREGRTSEHERGILAQVAPTILSAIRTQESIEHAGAKLLHGSLEAMDTAAILLDGLGKTTFVSPAAQRLLGPETLQISGGALHAQRPEFDRQLGRRIGQALAGEDPGPADLWIRTGKGLMLVDARPLPHGDWHLGLSARVIVSLRPLLPSRMGSDHAENAKKVARMGRQLGQAMGLTDTEGEVAALLAQGLSRKDIAALRQVSPQTVNSQLRTIFLKCEVNREGELVAIARSILDAIGS